jgi:predicted component of type VI protein secretion system
LKLRLVHEATKTLIALPESGTLAIGREGSPLSKLLENDLGISRRHAEIVVSGGGYLLRHLAPQNETELLPPAPRTQRTLLAPGASERLEAGHRIRLQSQFLLVEAVPQREPKPIRVDEPKRDTRTASPTPSGAQADTPLPTPEADTKPARCKYCSHSHAITPAVDAYGTWACENCLEPNQAAVAR